jgi:hypothetical protein
MSEKINKLKQFFTISTASFAWVEGLSNCFGKTPGEPSGAFVEMKCLHYCAKSVIDAYESKALSEESALVVMDLLLEKMEQCAERNAQNALPTPNFPMGGLINKLGADHHSEAVIPCQREN